MSEENKHIIKSIMGASGDGSFLEYIYKASLGNQQNRDQIAETLIAMHNKGNIDIIKELMKLNNCSDSAPNFFSTKHILEQTLPLINAPVKQVTDCVHHLIREAGADLSAEWIAEPFTKYCEVEISRVDEALEYILSTPERLSNLVPPVLIAGSNRDIGMYVQKALDLFVHTNTGIRSNALFALGRIKFTSNPKLTTKVLGSIKGLCEIEDNDLVLSNAIRTITKIIIEDNSKVDRGANIIESVLPRCGEQTTFTISSIFSLELKILPERFVKIFLEFLHTVNPEHVGILNNIGFGLASLLKQDSPKKGIAFLESLLLKHNGKLTIDSFGHLTHSIIEQGVPFLGRLMTRWFLKGDYILCNSIKTIVDKIHSDDPHLKIDTTQLSSEKSFEHIFIARKTIGFLFFKPVTCISILLSLMENSGDEEIQTELSGLIFDPILMNFGGKALDFLKQQLENSTDPISHKIQNAITAVDNYLEGLRSVPELPEMHPSQEQREVQVRQQNTIMSESFKEAQRGSILQSICSHSVLLYGSSSIMRIYDGSGNSHRTEIPMQPHSVSFEIPRQTAIDPFGLDYQLRLFRNMRLTNL